MTAPQRIGTGTAALCAQFGCWMFPRAVKTSLARLAGTGLTLAYGSAVVLPHPRLAGTVTALGAAAWCLAAWNASEPGEEQDDEAEAEALNPDDVLVLVWELVARDGRGVLLTALRDALQVETTKEVRELLAEMGIPVRKGVRTDAGNGPGLHHTDLPPLPSPAAGAPPVGVVGAGQDANTNTNSPSVEEIADGVVIVKYGPDRRQRVRRINWPPAT